ncbi:4-aminobutyrate aminotransferase-like enzyme [Variovorax beijingensis]|uniref:4-aminobutyrate aminotransferase-like enzyme n=1 Tax=Variovorax beijingensis TaxID=2496117 RepID=A0A561CHY9_9BURK|nr:aspartate aminotransferase family protein [Variovorax beijingensis]TWD90640.1 4-aminobutyrate aminotransferase-like enzyme [Variovorax beijingensis]
MTSLAPSTQALVERRARVLGPAYRLFYDTPLHPVRGEGVWLYDAEGRPHLDAYNNVASVGHCHPHVVEAIARQAGVLNTHTRYLHEGVLDYAERLLATLPAELAHAMFTCTGSEANDLAMRIARAHTKAEGLIVTRFAYHGVTASIAEASPSLGKFVQLGDAVRTVPAPDSYRIAPGELGRAFANGVREAITDLKAQGMRPAALMVDTVFSSDGIFTDPPGFMAEAVDAVREAGGLFIADEVQPGLGRTGDAFWGFQRHGVVPDIVTMGKPLGAGHPLAGLAVRPGVLAAFGRECRYFNTFGGNPVSMAAGMAVLDVIEREGLMANAQRVGRYLRAQIAKLAERHALIGDVRGAGLFVGVELVTDRRVRTPATAETARIVNGLRERQVLLSATGEHASTLKIRPPLVFSEAHADLLVETLDQVLAGL